jgi:hypothetical protein
MEEITERQWASQFHRMERANLKNHHRSTTWVSMMNQAGDLIVETRDNSKTLFVRKNWRSEVKTRFLVPPDKDKKHEIEIIRGNDARTIAERKARYGHRDWVVWTDKSGERCTALATSETVKMAMLATGTQSHFILVHQNDATGWVMSWSIANTVRRNLSFYEKQRGQ